MQRFSLLANPRGTAILLLGWSILLLVFNFLDKLCLVYSASLLDALFADTSFCQLLINIFYAFFYSRGSKKRCTCFILFHDCCWKFSKVLAAMGFLGFAAIVTLRLVLVVFGRCCGCAFGVLGWRIILFLKFAGDFARFKLQRRRNLAETFSVDLGRRYWFSTLLLLLLQEEIIWLVEVGRAVSRVDILASRKCCFEIFLPIKWACFVAVWQKLDGNAGAIWVLVFFLDLNFLYGRDVSWTNGLRFLLLLLLRLLWGAYLV